MKKLFLIPMGLMIIQACSNPQVASKKVEVSVGKSYVLTINKEKFDQAANKFVPDNVVDTIKATNDTVAYLDALKKYYGQKVIERANFNYGQPKSFSLFDANGVDLKATLQASLIDGLVKQVESTPEVSKMIEEYKKDSL